MHIKVLVMCLVISVLYLSDSSSRGRVEAFNPKAAETDSGKSSSVENIKRSIIAYAKNASRDRKYINIPEGYAYVSHSTRITTANPQDGENTEWFRSEGVRRDPRNASRIIAVWVEVRAMGRPLFGASRWIGVELTVELRPL